MPTKKISQFDTPAAYCPLAVLRDEEWFTGAVRNAGVTDGVLPLVPACVPPCVLELAFGDELLRSTCASCSTVGSCHKAVPVCSSCHRETVILSVVQGSSPAQLQAGPTGARVHPGTWMHFNSASDLMDVRGVCSRTDCGHSGSVAVGFVCCGSADSETAQPSSTGCTGNSDALAAFSPACVGHAGSSRCKALWDGRDAAGLAAALCSLWGGDTGKAAVASQGGHK